MSVVITEQGKDFLLNQLEEDVCNECGQVIYKMKSEKNITCEDHSKVSRNWEEK